MEWRKCHKDFLIMIILILGSLCQLSRAEEEHDHEHDSGDYFHLLADLSNTATAEGLDAGALDFILTGLNVNQCLNSSTLLNGSAFIGEDDFLGVAEEILKFLINNGCQLDNPLPTSITTACRADLKTILDFASQYTKWTPVETAAGFSTTDLIPTGNCIAGDGETAIQAYAHMFTSLLSGENMLPTSDDFHKEIVELTDKNGDQRINETELMAMLGMFSLATGADEHADHAHEEEDHAHEDEQAAMSADPDDHDHDDHDHEHDHDRRRRAVEEEHDHEEHKCYSADDYLSIAGYTADANGEVSIAAADLSKVYPIIVEQVMTSACTADAHDDHSPSSSSNYTDAQKWGYAIATNIVISLLAFIGLLTFGSFGSASFDLILQFFIALGIGTLSGDALLHLLPQVLGLHAEHGTEGHDHAAHEEEESLDHVWKLLVVVAGLYVFFLFENGLRLWNTVTGQNITMHHHGENTGHKHRHRSTGKKNNSTVVHPTTAAGGVENGGFEPDDGDEKSSKKANSHVDHPATEEDDSKKVYFWGLNAVGFMVLFGDALHNAADGLAIGVAFSSSWVSGLGTALAIFCHELPHEFGDFAIYLNNGASRSKALFLNFIAACFSFIGLFIGLALGTNTGYTQWLLAIIAGMFLYISLVNIMQEMMESVSDYPKTEFFVQNLGLLLGWAIMLLLALYEEDLIMSIKG